ncbi:uncharacterized protein LOC123218331 isoform X2 [Mangifera indica]|uniref:uncharacterized protein LOC123218331 isoform X2 n=1 Tax=Mangifera indica TaxID=29780 RepID=UPI001CFB10F3|nr:uncharacterized protein LOC123218331 isoform X2 [Mangifera indica]
MLEDMTSLQSIIIWDCKFDNTTFNQDFPTFKNLKYLSIYSTHLRMHSGSFLERGICNSLQLQVLQIVDSDLWGSLPWCLANLTSLKHLISHQINLLKTSLYLLSRL